MNIGYHASHEQFRPSELLRYVQLAESEGFRSIHSSDHFYPWSESQGQSGFSLSWIGAAMQSSTLPYSLICTPGYRYHPAIVAQAAATLSEMFPNRFTLELGSGEALNEHISGMPWPSKSQRNARLENSAKIIRKLLNGEKVVPASSLHPREVKLYTLPNQPPPIYGAALTPVTAAWLGTWADGLVTTAATPEAATEIVAAFHRGGGEGKPVTLKLQLSYAATEAEALTSAYQQWRTNLLPPAVIAEVASVAEFEERTRHLMPEQVKAQVHVSSSLKKHTQWLKSFDIAGVSQIVLHNVNRSQEQFIIDFGQKVLPELM